MMWFATTRHCRQMTTTTRFATALNVTLGAALLVVGSSALAQNATRGRQLYENTNNAPLSCSAPGVCHGPDPSSNLNKIKNGTNPAVIQVAVTNVSLMNFLSTYLTSATDRADIAAYIANPGSAGGGGGGGAGSFSVSANSLTFGGTQIGTSNTTPSPASITLTNSSTGTLTITGINKSGTNATDFTPTGSCVSAAPVVVAAGGSCTLGVSFMPSGIGTRTATLTVASNSVTNPAVSISGSGSASPVATVALNRAAIAFPTQTIATTSNAQDVTISNQGMAPLMITNVSTSPMPEFVSTTNCLTTLTTGSTCTVTVAFTPSAAGTRTGTIALTTNVGATNIPLTGFSVLTPTAIAAADKTTLAFPSTPIGATSAPSSFTFTNTGNAPMQVTSVAMGGGDASQFKMGSASTCKAGTLAAFASCRVDLAFAPQSAGGKSTTVTVAHNASGGATTMTATGMANAMSSSSALAPSNIGGAGAASLWHLVSLALMLLLVPVMRRALRA